MMKPLYIVVALLLIGCSEKEKEDAMEKNNAQTRETKEKVIEGEFSNPAVFLGSDLGNFMRSLYLIGDFERMLQFTDSLTIAKFGREKLLEHYSDLDMGIAMKLKSIDRESDSTGVLHYQVNYRATSEARRLRYVIENDTAKISYSHLKNKTLFYYE